MKTIYSRLILALVFLLAVSTVLAEETDLKELRYTYENHITTNDSITEYFFHLEHSMVLTVNHAGSLADSTSLRLWERMENGAEYTLVTEAYDYTRAFDTAYLWNYTGMAGKVKSDTLTLKNAQAFFCRSLPAGHYKLTSSRKGGGSSTGCLPELKTNIYAQAAWASQTDPVKALLNRSGVSCWNAPYQGKCILYYQLSVECNMTVDIEAYDTGSSTLIMKDATGLAIAQGEDNKIIQQTLTPGIYNVSILVEEGYCGAGIRIRTTDEIGNTIDRPITIPIESYDKYRNCIDISYLADTYGEKEKDAVYSFYLPGDAMGIFYSYYSHTTQNSRVFLTVLNERKEVMAKSSSLYYSTRLRCKLGQGMYYLVCEGGKDLDGTLCLEAQIYPLSPIPPEPEPEPDPDPEPEPENPDIPEQPESYMPSASRNYIQIVIPTISSDSVASFSYLSKARHQIQ